MTSKELQTLRARAALVGMALEPTTDDQDRPSYVLSTGPFTVLLRSGESIEAWLSQAALQSVPEGSHA